MSTWEQQINATWPANPSGLKTSRSDPALPIPLSPPPAPASGGGAIMVISYSHFAEIPTHLGTGTTQKSTSTVKSHTV